MTAESRDQIEIPRGYDRQLCPRPRLILFDLDNTLCDHATSLHIRLHHAFEPILPSEAEREALVEASKLTATDGTRHFEELFARFGIESVEAVEKARRHYVSDRYRGLELFEDALEALEATSEIATIGLVTNGPTDIQQQKIDLLGVEPAFAFTLISEREGYWKPDPRIFELALAKAGCAAHEAVYLGDSPAHDVRGAHAAGMRSIWVNRAGILWPEGEEPPAIEVRGLREMLTSLGLRDGAS